MKTRTYLPADYPALAALYRQRGLPPPQPDMLPADVILIEDSAGLVTAAGCLFVGLPLAWLAFLVTSPQATSHARHAALDKIIEQLTRRAKQLGAKGVVASLGHVSLIKRHENQGYAQTDKGVTTLFKKL